jgi:hypothetical protein
MRLGRPDYCASESRIRDPEPGEDPVPNVRDMESRVGAWYLCSSLGCAYRKDIEAEHQLILSLSTTYA